MKKITIALFTILTISTANADTFSVCTGVKNVCVEGVKLFTEKISPDRVEGIYRCMVIKNDCNNLFSNITAPLDQIKK